MTDSYFTEIEEHFQRARGAGLMLSPRDWALVEGWKKAGIPIEAALRGIDAAFEKWRRRPVHARTQMVNSLAYCAQAVAAEAQAMVNGARFCGSATTSRFTLESVRDFVTRNAVTLRSGGHEDLATLLEALDLGALYQDLEQLDRTLTAIEERMITKLRAAANGETTTEAARALDRQLKPYRGKMSAEQLATLEKQFLDRRLLESLSLPRLSLFYLE